VSVKGVEEFLIKLTRRELFTELNAALKIQKERKKRH